MNLGFAFRDLRHRKFPNKEMNQTQIAKAAGITQTYLSQIELGRKEPTISVVHSLCKVYGVPPAILFWLAAEPKDVKKNKQEAFKMIREPMNALISELIK